MTNAITNYERNKRSYAALLVLSVFFIIVAAISNQHENFLLAIPTLALTAYAFDRKDTLYIPPLFVFILAVTMTLLQLTKILEEGSRIITFTADVLLGMFTGILGLMMIMSLLKSSSNFDVQKPFFVSFSACCIGITLAMLLCLADLCIEFIDPNFSVTDIGEFMLVMGFCILGSSLVSLLFYLNRNNGLFKHTIDKFLNDNANSLGLEDQERKKALREIEEGESSKLEFKSTLRTNLKTGEKDVRMEKAVLKSIVAFLNSKGGTLYIGVADDGSILGVDLESFDGSKDKFNLHLNNLITKQIGSEFIPFINYYFIEIEDKSIMRVVCRVSDRPVFLDDGKEKIFFVRSGPSSIDLHGMELLYYANHNFGKSLKRNNL